MLICSSHVMKTADVNTVFIRKAEHRRTTHLTGSFNRKLQSHHLVNFRDQKQIFCRKQDNISSCDYYMTIGRVVHKYL